MSAPPLSEQLVFARNTKTGRVHILAGPGHDGAEQVRGAFSELSAEQIVEIVLARTPMLCGKRLWAGPFEHFHAVYVAGDDFPDDDLCAGCVRALGDESWRAFHIDNRGGGS